MLRQRHRPSWLGVRRPDEESTAAGIYGTVVAAAVMAASHAGTAAQLTLSVLVTLVVYWAAERYARLVAARIHAGRRPSRAQVRQQLTEGWGIVTVSALPLGVLAVLTVLGAGLAVAGSAALVASTVLLACAGWEIGAGSNLSRGERVATTLGAAAFGVVMIGLKALLH